MNVRITPRHALQRTDQYGGVLRVTCDGKTWTLHRRLPQDNALLPFVSVAEIALDEDAGDWW